MGWQSYDAVATSRESSRNRDSHSRRWRRWGCLFNNDFSKSWFRRRRNNIWLCCHRLRWTKRLDLKCPVERSEARKDTGVGINR